MNYNIDISLEYEKWQDYLVELKELVNRITGEAFSMIDEVPRSPIIEVSLLLTNDSYIKTLNHEFRNKNKATNVLSFPSYEQIDENTLLLGDIAISYDTIEIEATEQGKDFKDHFIHMYLHGLLHLLDYDHLEENMAREMENLEITILKKFNINNPYEAN